MNKNYVGRFSFELINTPGTKGSEEPLKHAHLLKEALTYAKLNTKIDLMLCLITFWTKETQSLSSIRKLFS